MTQTRHGLYEIKLAGKSHYELWINGNYFGLLESLPIKTDLEVFNEKSI